MKELISSTEITDAQPLSEWQEAGEEQQERGEAGEERREPEGEAGEERGEAGEEEREPEGEAGEERGEAGDKQREGWRAARTPVALAGLLAALHLLGVRSDAVVLSGTAPPGVGTLLGLIYVGLWLVCVVAVPPWLAGLLAEGWSARVMAYRAARQSHPPRATGS